MTPPPSSAAPPLPDIVGVVGLGTIGQRWAALFAHAGMTVGAYDVSPDAEARLRAALPVYFAELDQIRPRASQVGTIAVHDRLEPALAGAGFVQENAPEEIALKRALLPRIERCVAPETIIASSSTALLVSDMQQDCVHPERIVLGHPFNPAHLMPLVEIVGGRSTAPPTLERARDFYAALGKQPVILHREIPGHVAVRLMAAMWREAIHLVQSGVVSVEDADRAFCFGPGPKWFLQGSFISNHLGAEGIEAFLAKFGPTYEALWADLGTARLDAATCAQVAAGTRAAIGDIDDDALRRARDAGLIELLKVQQRFGPY